MRDAKGEVQHKCIPMLSSAAPGVMVGGKRLVRLRTPLCGGEQQCEAFW